MKTLLTLATALALCTGCSVNPSVDPYADPAWGPGVTDADTLHRKLEAIVADIDHDKGVYLNIEDCYHAVGMASAMTWEQAAYVYRNASIPLKSILCHRLIPGGIERYQGMTPSQVISLLGEPDGHDAGEYERTLIYTGEGGVSDSMSGIIFNFDENGVFSHIGYAN